MSNIQKILDERKLPDLLCGVKNRTDFEKKQEKIKKLLADREYGEMPRNPDHMFVEQKGESNKNFAAGRAERKSLTFSFEMEGKSFSFPAMSVIPHSKKKLPAFVYIDFDGGEGNKYMPTEEIAERGFALFTFCYKDVTSDDNNFKDGIAKHLVKSRRRNNAPGKIALWAWAAMRVMDYVATLGDVIDLENVAVVGHSRLGKTALLAGAYDTRFKYVISNDSGCCGAAIESGKVGERYKRISEVFPYWFCPAFNRDAGAGNPLPFDQNFLLSLSVPRCVIVGSAVEDLWADPTSEFLGVASLQGAYKLFGMRGLVHNDEVPAPRAVLDEGDAVYYVREGTHYMSRYDWNTYMDIIEKRLDK
jgi:hypothetical protein